MFDKIVSIYSNLSVSTRKLDSASKFIDFFVHDILDYTLLSKEDRNFQKNCSVCDVKEAVNEIVQILEDKISMKQIKLITSYEGFESTLKVKTDCKRL